MSLEGYCEYQRREYCRDIRCPVQEVLEKQKPGSADYETVRTICKAGCIHSTYEFHHWLIEKGYLLLRPEKR
ncbi:MAG: hypothetical protein JW881_16435 [Spirochaetales bacterium]|nr:hypothetical protein [Spirochaetales bacterium]